MQRGFSNTLHYCSFCTKWQSDCSAHLGMLGGSWSLQTLHSSFFSLLEASCFLRIKSQNGGYGRFGCCPYHMHKNANPVNEFLTKHWHIMSLNIPAMQLSLSILMSRGMYYKTYYIIASVWGSSSCVHSFANFTLTLAIQYLKPLNQQQVIEPDKVVDGKRSEASETQNTEVKSKIEIVKTCKILPFQPLAVHLKTCLILWRCQPR